MPPSVVFFFLILSVILSIAGFAMMGTDKKKAAEHSWRISEKSLFLVAAIGGGIGVLIGMWFFHHKTKHVLFLIGIPLIILVQAFLLGYLFVIM